MTFNLPQRATLVLCSMTALVCIPARPQQPAAPAPQVIQTGALNAPTGVLTQDNQWSNLISILSNKDLDLYIEDPSSDAWLARNAQNFLDRGQYTITLVSFYKTRGACREDQIRAGFDDAEHINACDGYRYRIRQVAVDAPQNALTLRFAAMVFTGGTLDSSSILRETRTRGFDGLDADSQKALSDTTKLVAKQSSSYEARQHNSP
jgi:hypothetical protein